MVTFPRALTETGPPPAAPEAEPPSGQVIAFPGAAQRPPQTPVAAKAEVLERLNLDARTLQIQYAQVYRELCRLDPTLAFSENIPEIAAAVERYFAALLRVTNAPLAAPPIPLEREP